MMIFMMNVPEIQSSPEHHHQRPDHVSSDPALSLDVRSNLEAVDQLLQAPGLL